jgi:hypothetical protein
MKFSIQKMIKLGDSDMLEFKSSFNREVIETACAFANRTGGTILVGSTQEVDHSQADARVGPHARIQGLLRPMHPQALPRDGGSVRVRGRGGEVLLHQFVFFAFFPAVRAVAMLDAVVFPVQWGKRSRNVHDGAEKALR